MANNDKNFKVKNGLDVKGSATVDNDLLVSGTLTAQTNTPSADSDVVNKAYVDSRDTHDEAAVSSQIDSAFGVKSTTDLAEGNNLYYTTTRADSDFDVRLATKTTTNLAEGNNLYYTTARADSDTTALVDSDYVEGKIKQSFIDTFDTHDSAAVQGQIDASISATDTHDSAAVLGQINATVNQTFIDAFDTHDSAAVQGQIDATIALTDTHDSAAVVNQIEREVDLAFINALDASATNLDSDLIPGLVLGTDVNGNYVVDVTGTANQIEVTHTQGEGSTPVIGLPNNVTIDSDLTVNGVIKGPATMIIDPALHGDSSGTLVILGNLQVDGVSTVIQSSTVSITDKNIVLADSATNTTEANGAGITVNGANASITYVASGDKWELNKAPYYLNDRLLTTADDTHDSAAVVGQINDVVNEAYVQGKIDQTFIDTFDTHDSAAVVGQIGLEVDQTFIDQFDTHDSAAVLGQINATVNQAYIDALDTHDSAAVLGQINTVIAATDTHDSAAVLGQINATVNQTYIDALDTHDSAAVLGQINATVNQTFIDAFDTHDSAAVVGQIGLEVTKTFIDNLDVDAVTLGGNDSSYYLDYNNFTNTPTLPAQVISYDSASELADSAVDARTDQDLFTTSDVEFNKVNSNLVGSVHFTAQNDEGTALVVGDVVYIKGISGNTPTVAKADADDATKMPAFGIVSSGANNGANVTVTTFGEIANIDTSSFSLGDTLYVSTVAGSFTATKPTGETSLLQNVGQVTRVHSSGSIKVLGAGRTAATPNLGQNRIFIGNALNQSITMSLDSAVDSDHVQSKIKQSFIDTFDTHDSAAVAGQIADTLNDTVTITKHSTSDPVLKLQSTVSTSDAAPIMEFVRNTDQANNGDYIGQIKFIGEDSSGTVDGSGIVYAKVTGKISDPTDGTEDGLIEYMVKSNGSNLIMARMTGNDGGKLIMENGAGIEVVSGNITVAGNTVLTTASDTHDSAAVVGQIGLEVTKTFVDALAIDYSTLSNKPTIPAFGTDYVDSAEVNILIAAADTHDSAAVVGQIGLEVNKTFVDNLDVDAITLGGNDSSYYLNYNNFTNTPTIPVFGTDYVDSAAARGLVSGNKGLSYNSTTGVFDIDSANIYSFTIDSARTIDLIDSAYIQPLARAAIVAGTNITYDSATGVISSSGGGAYDSAMTGAQIDSAALSYTLDFVTTKGNTTTNDITVGALIADSATFDTDTLVVDATNNRVGVGTTSPTAKLDVNGEVFVSTLTPSTDSALATKKYVDDNAGGGPSSHTVVIGLLDTTGRAGTSLTQALDVGDPVYYDDDANVWTGAVDSAAGVASHVIVEKNVDDFKIAQTGIFTLTPNQGLDINSYYYLGDSAGKYTTTQPVNGIYQSLFYAVDSSTVDINIAEAQDISPSSPNETRITTINITSTPYTIPVNSTGKMFVLGSGAGTLNLNAANFFTGDVLTLYNNSASTRTLTFDTYSDAVRIPGSATNYSASSITIEAYGMASVTAITDNGLIIAGGVS